MQRTQIYLTADQKARLEAIARSRSVSMADVIRDAVSEYLTAGDKDVRLRLLEQSFGVVTEWRDRDGVEFARELRHGWRRAADDDPRSLHEVKGTS